MCIVTLGTIVEFVSDIDGARMDTCTSLQDGWTALMAASQTVQVECVKMLLDRGAKVNLLNEASGVIIHRMHAMQLIPSIPVVDDDMCLGTLFRACL